MAEKWRFKEGSKKLAFEGNLLYGRHYYKYFRDIIAF